MAVHKVKDKPVRKARKARRNGARARTSAANGAHSKPRRKRKSHKVRRNGIAAAHKPRGKRTYRKARRNGVSGTSLTNVSKPGEMILTAGAGALGAVAVGAIAQGLVSNVDFFKKPENAAYKSAIPGVAAAAAGLAIAKIGKSKGAKTAGIAMALAGTVILVKDVAGKKVEEVVGKALPSGQPAGAWMNGMASDFAPRALLDAPSGHVAGAWMGAMESDFVGKPLF